MFNILVVKFRVHPLTFLIATYRKKNLASPISSIFVMLLINFIKKRQSSGVCQNHLFSDAFFIS